MKLRFCFSLGPLLVFHDSLEGLFFYPEFSSGSSFWIHFRIYFCSCLFHRHCWICYFLSLRNLFSLFYILFSMFFFLCSFFNTIYKPPPLLSSWGTKDLHSQFISESLSAPICHSVGISFIISVSTSHTYFNSIYIIQFTLYNLHYTIYNIQSSFPLWDLGNLKKTAFTCLHKLRQPPAN